MRALNIIRGISKALMFVVLYFILYNYTQGLQTMAIGFCLAMVLLINIVLVINYYEINKSYEKCIEIYRRDSYNSITK
jgi:riboflavin transporter FmnP